MITLINTSKTMRNWPLDGVELTKPRFDYEAHTIAKQLQSYSEQELKALMHISDQLAAATHDKYQRFPDALKSPALFAFNGDIYTGLKAKELDASALNYAQANHLFILSGLYGLLRPFDMIKPYRLELMYKLKINGASLKDFWGRRVAEALPTDDVILNLASEEYFGPLRPHLRDRTIISPEFLVSRDGVLKFEAVHAKKARGMMAAWVINNPDKEVSDFTGSGYSSKISDPANPIFWIDSGDIVLKS